MPLSKTLGQVAREAYENAIEAHDPDELHARFPRDSFWQAAAEAVARATVAEVRTQMSDMHSEKYEAVIEAAKAKNHLERCIKKPDWSGCVATALQEADERIRAAVEALEEVER